MIQFIFKSGKVTKFTYGKYKNISKEKLDEIREKLIEMIISGLKGNDKLFLISDIEGKDHLIIKNDSIDQVNVYFDIDSKDKRDD